MTPVEHLSILSFAQVWAPTMPQIAGYTPDLAQADQQHLLLMPRVPLAREPILVTPDFVCVDRALDREDAVNRALDREDATSRKLRGTCL